MLAMQMHHVTEVTITQSSLNITTEGYSRTGRNRWSIYQVLGQSKKVLWLTICSQPLKFTENKWISLIKQQSFSIYVLLSVY